ncbi:MAG: EpsG family protein [Paenibacillaceae bacterium]
MTILWINLAIVYSLSLLSRVLVIPKTIGATLIKPNKAFVFIAVLSLVLISGLRKNIGDTFAYLLTYRLVPEYNWDFILAQKEQGFIFLQLFLHKFSANPQILIFTVALITNVIIGIILYQYSRFFELSLYVYITSGLYLVSMNGIRQFLAGAILFAGTKYIMDGSWKKYMLVVFLATTVHQSALILIPIYFIVRREAWTKTTLFLLFLAVVLAIGYNQFSGAFFEVIGDSTYGQYKDFQEGGANILRVMVQAAPLLPAYFGRKKLRELLPKSDYIVNLSLLGLVFMIISTQNWIFARFIIYFGLYNLILISWVVPLFAKQYQKLIYYVILVTYFIYFFYESVISLGIIYKSDYL